MTSATPHTFCLKSTTTSYWPVLIWRWAKKKTTFLNTPYWCICPWSNEMVFRLTIHIPFVYSAYLLVNNYLWIFTVLVYTPQPFYSPFSRTTQGESVSEENFWILWCKGRLMEADTPTIQLGATPSGLTSAHLHHPPIFYRPSCHPTNSVKALKASSAWVYTQNVISCSSVDAINCSLSETVSTLFCFVIAESWCITKEFKTSSTWRQC